MDDVPEKIKTREEDSHKYDFGSLLVVGGSKTYSGSPTFNSLAAYRSGVDLVTTASPKRAADIIASFSPSLIVEPLEGDYVSPEYLGRLEELEENADAVLIGGGLERRTETFKTVTEFLKQVEIPAVIDADAIHAVARNKDILREGFVLTPHAREFEVLTGEEVTEENARKAAEELGCVILLKGKEDVITDGDEVLKNGTGNQYMTVGGTGDTLAGIVGSLLAQGLDPLEAAYRGAWINGKAGEIASEEKGVGMLPDDLLEKIPQAIQESEG